MAKDFNGVPKWQNFAKSGHTDLKRLNIAIILSGAAWLVHFAVKFIHFIKSAIKYYCSFNLIALRLF